MNQKEADRLLAKYLDNTATRQERSLIDNWFINESGKRKLSDDVDFDHLTAELWAGAQKRAGLAIQPKTRSLWPRITVAASILFILSFGLFFLLKDGGSKQRTAGNKIRVNASFVKQPILVLSDGKKIVLEHAQNGLLAKQGSSLITKSVDGVLSYQPAIDHGTHNMINSYNSLMIPRGADYQLLVLSDGTKVWINSASSLRYPTAFSGDERKVELNGEAYFEVAHNPAKPFKVVSKDQTVEVLGTHFNVNAYNDEPAVHTTLLEGKVKVTAAADHAIRYLLPGQQSVLGPKVFTVNPSETDEAVAWKNGQFIFQNDPIPYIMRVIARRYDMQVEYQGPVPEGSFGGTISRNTDVSESLNILQLTGKVQFHIEGRRIIVSK